MTAKWGAIFDFDGVIVDTERHHGLCWQKVAQEQNKTCSREQYLSGFGVKNERFIGEILAWTTDPEEIAQISKRKEAIFQEHAKTAHIELVQGVDVLLAALENNKVPCAIASSSILENIHTILRKSHIRKYFSQIVSAEDVQQGKPNPDCFLQAAKKLALAPEKCVVFEDALLGIEAGKRAGCKVVAITTTFSRGHFEALSYKPDVIIDRFSDLNMQELESWFH